MKNYVLKVTLANTDITRTLAIPADYGFYDLHEAIQIAFGWEGFFYHEFEVSGITIADDAEYSLNRMLEGVKAHFVEDAIVYQDSPSTFKDTSCSCEVVTHVHIFIGRLCFF